MKTITALGAVLALLGSLMTLPAMADPDLDEGIEAITCPDFSIPADGSITVLGKASTINAATVIEGDPDPVPCGALQVGDQVKVSCTDNTCVTAAKIKFKPASAESSVAAAACPYVGGTALIELSNAVICEVRPDAQVKQPKSNPLGVVPPAKPTVTDLMNFLCDQQGLGQLGIAFGTNEDKCAGHNLGGGVLDTFKVEVKK
jgi:hypothetical protein